MHGSIDQLLFLIVSVFGTQPFGFKGAAADPVAEGAGLVWMGVCAYLPALGRFTTVDSAGVAAGWNQHDGLGSDPINLIDADGRFFAAVLALPVAVQAGAAIAGAIGLSLALNPEAAQRLGEMCVEPFRDIMDRAEDAGGDEDGDAPPPYEDHAGEVRSKSDEKRLRRTTASRGGR